MINNSSDLLEAIRKIAVNQQTTQINIRQLADQLRMTLAQLVSILTELEHRDKIVLEIKTSMHP